MKLDTLDGGPGPRPLILVIDDKMIVVLAIASDPGVTAGARLVLRCQGDEVLASIEPTPGRAKQGPTKAALKGPPYTV